MWRLFISDLRNRWLDWVGIILVAFFCGVASGWSALLPFLYLPLWRDLLQRKKSHLTLCGGC